MASRPPPLLESLRSYPRDAPDHTYLTGPGAIGGGCDYRSLIFLRRALSNCCTMLRKDSRGFGKRVGHLFLPDQWFSVLLLLAFGGTNTCATILKFPFDMHYYSLNSIIKSAASFADSYSKSTRAASGFNFRKKAGLRDYRVSTRSLFTRYFNDYYYDDYECLRRS
jgi:hypothetical protein